MRARIPLPFNSLPAAIPRPSDDDLWQALGAVDHARHLHGAAREGRVTIATRDVRTNRWFESRIALDDMAPIAGCRGSRDTYVSYNTFAGRSRRSENLVVICALYADIDHYKLVGNPMSRLPAEAVVDLVLAHLATGNVPPPSLVLDTGRGVGLTWLIDPIPAAAHPRWKACQKLLRDLLAPFGHDAAAIDASRCTRLIGTINSANGRVVRLMPNSTLVRHDFEALASCLLPFTRAEIVDLRERRRDRRAKQPAPKTTGRPKYDCRTLHEAILADLRKLVRGRYGGPAPAGRRNDIVLRAANSLSFLLPPDQLRNAITAIGSELANWSPSASLACAASVIGRAKRRKRAVNGQDPRYRYSATRMVADLSITEDEMRGFDLRVLRSKPIERERDRARKDAARRATGRPTQRQRYDELRRSRQRALDLFADGWTAREVGQEMGLSRDAAKKLIQRAKAEGMVPTAKSPERQSNVVTRGGDSRFRVYDGEPHPPALQPTHRAVTTIPAMPTTGWRQLDLFGAPEPPEPWLVGGLMPNDVRVAVRLAIRTTRSSHGEIAAMVGVSRPQLTNIVAGRFGTRPEVGRRLSDWVLSNASAA